MAIFIKNTYLPGETCHPSMFKTTFHSYDVVIQITY